MPCHIICMMVQRTWVFSQQMMTCCKLSGYFAKPLDQRFHEPRKVRFSAGIPRATNEVLSKPSLLREAQGTCQDCLKHGCRRRKILLHSWRLGKQMWHVIIPYLGRSCVSYVVFCWETFVACLGSAEQNEFQWLAWLKGSICTLFVHWSCDAWYGSIAN